MGLLSSIPVIGKVIESALNVVDKVVADKDLAAKLKAEIQTQLLSAEYGLAEKELEARASVIVAEATGEGALQRNWRPILMLTFTYIIAHNFIVAPVVTSFGFPLPTLPIPEPMWNLLNLGVGGYIVGRSGEKMVKAWAGSK